MEFTSDHHETAILGLGHPVDEAALIEERRKRREAIKAKHRLQKSPLLAATPAMASHGHPITAMTISGISQSHVLGMFIPQRLDLLINLRSIHT